MKKTYKKIHSTKTLSNCIIMMDTCTFLCSIGQWLETNLGCFDQALVALWFRSGMFIIFSNIDQVYGSGIEIVRQILQNRQERINHADTDSTEGNVFQRYPKFYYSILRRKRAIETQTLFITYCIYKRLKIWIFQLHTIFIKIEIKKDLLLMIDFESRYICM